MKQLAVKRLAAAWLALGFLLSGPAALRGDNDRIVRIQAAFARKLDRIQLHPRGWQDFKRENADLFPQDDCGEWVVVRKEKMALETGESVAVGVAYSQVFIPAAMDRVMRYLGTTRWFRELYNLDACAVIASPCPGTDDAVRARIFKRVPLLPDQDFVLELTWTRQKDIRFQRGRLVEDRKRFAVRDNLKILVPEGEGVIYREISLVYPRRWWARAAGPTFRSVMRREVREMVAVLRCVISAGPEPVMETTRRCRLQARRN